MTQDDNKTTLSLLPTGRGPETIELTVTDGNVLTWKISKNIEKDTFRIVGILDAAKDTINARARGM